MSWYTEDRPFLVRLYRGIGGKDFPGTGKEIKGPSPRLALERNFPEYRFQRNPPLSFPTERRIIVDRVGVKNRTPSETVWGYTLITGEATADE